MKQKENYYPVSDFYFYALVYVALAGCGYLITKYMSEIFSIAIIIWLVTILVGMKFFVSGINKVDIILSICEANSDKTIYRRFGNILFLWRQQITCRSLICMLLILVTFTAGCRDYFWIAAWLSTVILIGGIWYLQIVWVQSKFKKYCKSHIYKL